MPVYDYKCPDHGIFYQLQTVAEHDRPQACPSCGEMSARIIRLAPGLLQMPASERKAHATNEQARHQPKTLGAVREELAERGHSCCSQHKPRTSGMLLTARGEKMFPSQRPWMISH